MVQIIYCNANSHIEGIKHFLSNVGRQQRTEKVNGVVSDLGPNPDSRMCKLFSYQAVPPAVSFPCIYLFYSV